MISYELNFIAHQNSNLTFSSSSMFIAIISTATS